MEPSGPISGFKGRVKPLGQQVVASQAHVSSVGKYMTTSKLTDGQFSKPHLLDSTQLPEVTGVTASILADREQLALAGARSRTQVGLFPMYDFLSENHTLETEGEPSPTACWSPVDGTFPGKSMVCLRLGDGEQPREQPERERLPRSVFTFGSHNHSSH